MVHRASLTTLAMAVLITGLVPGLIGIVCAAAARFGAAYIMLTGVYLVWGVRVFSDRPALGLGLPFLMFALGRGVVHWPTIRTVIVDAGHESRRLAAGIKRHEGWLLVIVKRSEPAFKIVGLNWIPDQVRGRAHFRLARPATPPRQGLRAQLQTSETLIQIVASGQC